MDTTFVHFFEYGKFFRKCVQRVSALLHHDMNRVQYVELLKFRWPFLCVYANTCPEIQRFERFMIYQTLEFLAKKYIWNKIEEIVFSKQAFYYLKVIS